MRTLRSFLLASLMALITLSACAAEQGTPPAPAASLPVPATPTPQRQPLLRVAILGDVTTTNVWALFDQEGANYWNYATQVDYWPRLYRISPLTLQVEPVVADGEAPPVVCDQKSCTASVTLMPDLVWTDGASITAQDVAFTANTALRFQLGLTWREAYNPEYLERVEAVNDRTVKYFFGKPPNVSTWQYGVLQGPIVNQAYWQPRIEGAIAHLPDDALAESLGELEKKSLDMQAQVESLSLSLNTMAPSSQSYQDAAAQATRIQEDLNSVNQRLDKARNEYEAKIADAHQMLFTLGNTSEPTLGPWRFKDRIPGEFENTAVLGTPQGAPWFDSVRYVKVADEPSAVKSLLANDVDVVLSPAGLSPESVAQLAASSEIIVSRNITRKARFLVFNHDNPYLADPVLHRALACMLVPQDLIEKLNGEAATLFGFALDVFWRETTSTFPCQGEADETRREEAVRLLTSAGYFWDKEPRQDSNPDGLRTPEGSILPSLTVLTPAPEYDIQRASAAAYIVQQARLLGIPMDVQHSDVDSIIYAVYGSGEYDLALLGWQLSSYPAYLCEWFSPLERNPYAYDDNQLNSACDAWEQTTDLHQARRHAHDVQSILMRDLPLIPLYVAVRYDAYRNVRYPFDEIINGLTGLYGAPGLAIPIP